MSQRPSFKRPAPPSPLRCTGSCLRAVAVAAAFARGRPEHTSERLPRTRPRREHPHLPPTRGEVRRDSPGLAPDPAGSPALLPGSRGLGCSTASSSRTPGARRVSRGLQRATRAGRTRAGTSSAAGRTEWGAHYLCAPLIFFFFFYQHSNYSVHSRRNEISTMREAKIRAKSGRRFTPDTRAWYLA